MGNNVDFGCSGINVVFGENNVECLKMTLISKSETMSNPVNSGLDGKEFFVEFVEITVVSKTNSALNPIRNQC